MLTGLCCQSSDAAQSRDIPALTEAFVKQAGAMTLPFYVVSRDYDKTTGAFTLFVGGNGGGDLPRQVLPAGLYAALEIRPKLGFLWGPAIGAAKRWFYTRWLPDSGCEAENLEYELHTEKSTGRKPSVELLFAIRRRRV